MDKIGCNKFKKYEYLIEEDSLLKNICCILICLFLILTFIGSGSTSENGGVQKTHNVDYTGASDFSERKFIEHLNTLNIKDYEITNKTISRRPINDKHFVCKYETQVKNNESQYKLIYGYDILCDENGNFEILHEGTNVDAATYLIN